ncbi:MAG TPA: hypothetical protein VED59_00355, partial [Acidimicrobiales bacterium]|nr:hypothetical protein [Acidimicrobiales bacterium]
YAASFVLGERTGEEAAALAPLAKAWEARNKRAFLTGYLDHEGVDALLPAGALDREAVRLAFEVDKALYEVAYEEAYRPTWTGIPLAALSRLLTGPIDEPDGYSRHEDEGIESGEV